jgi:hypothetical protein
MTLTYTAGCENALIGRTLHLPEVYAAGEEHRQMVRVPEEVPFATWPHLTDALLDRRQAIAVRAASVEEDEVYGGCELRWSIRRRGMSYVLAVCSNHVLTTASGRTMAAATSDNLRISSAQNWKICVCMRPATVRTSGTKYSAICAK